jgi:hypothetical protein
MNPDPTSKQRWYQFTLRGMFWLTLGVSLPLAWLHFFEWDRIMVLLVLFIVALVAIEALAGEQTGSVQVAPGNCTPSRASRSA